MLEEMLPRVALEEDLHELPQLALLLRGRLLLLVGAKGHHGLLAGVRDQLRQLRGVAHKRVVARDGRNRDGRGGAGAATCGILALLRLGAWRRLLLAEGHHLPPKAESHAARPAHPLGSPLRHHLVQARRLLGLAPLVEVVLPSLRHGRRGLRVARAHPLHHIVHGDHAVEAGRGEPSGDRRAPLRVEVPVLGPRHLAQDFPRVGVPQQGPVVLARTEEEGRVEL
mmetsp:Transcript_12611/g.32658  ORF Transcript_12611/g.32658 Transcript_12611/m.32658 type:complete len:225 (+) Transcript_12611:1995-2669(+)